MGRKYIKALKRVSTKLVGSFVSTNRQPVIGTFRGKPVFIAIPYSYKLEQWAKKMSKDHNEGKPVTYDEYRKTLLEMAYEQLQSGLVIVRPSHIIATEALEQNKQKNKLLAAELLMDAANYFANRNSRHICTNCGHGMLPEPDDKPIEAITENT